MEKTKATYLLAYDVSDDKKRSKIHKLCTQTGWVMLQKSLYLKCNVSMQVVERLKDKILNIDQKAPCLFDSIIVIRMTSNQLKATDQIGYQFPFSSFLGEDRIEII